MTRVTLIIVLSVLFTRPLWAEHRVALLIGNAAYERTAPPTSPHPDLQAVRAALARRGFRTTVLRDLGARCLAEALERFAAGVPTRGTALVYYRGYAFEGEREGRKASFLLPVDAGARSPGEIGESGYRVTDLPALLHTKSGAGRQIVLVDGVSHPDRIPGPSPSLSRSEELAPNSLLGFASYPARATGRGATAASTKSRWTRILDDSMGLIEAVETASAWSTKTLASGGGAPAVASVAVSSPCELRPGARAGDEWVNARGMVFCWCPRRQNTEKGGPAPHGRGFWLAKFELTRRESELTSAMASALSGDHGAARTRVASRKAMASDKNHPMDMIHPSEMEACLKALNASEAAFGRLPAGWEYSLPTEAEWEHACRAGTRTRFFFGDDRAALPRYANFADKSLLGWSYTEYTLDDKTPQLALVGKYRANPWGLHDMYGNLCEWVESGGEEWVGRGGSWVSVPRDCCSSARRSFDKRRARNFLGYRIVLRQKP